MAEDGTLLLRTFIFPHTSISNYERGKNLQSRILYPARLLFRFEGEIKSIKDKQKLKQFNLMKSAIQEVLKGLF